MPTRRYWRPAYAVAIATLSGAAAVAQQDSAKPLRIVLIERGQSREITTEAATVQQLLDEQRIRLSSLDRCSSAPGARLSDGQRITLTRIRVETVTETVPLPFPTRRAYDPKLRAGAREVATTGHNGEVRRTFRDTYKDDQRISRVQVAETRSAPRTEVVRVGLRGLDLASRGEFASHRILNMSATGYGPGENGRWGSRTATGSRVGKGVVAVDPRFIPLGTRLYIEGYGYAVASDTGGAIKGLRIDLGFDSNSEASQMGRRKVRVMVLH